MVEIGVLWVFRHKQCSSQQVACTVQFRLQVQLLLHADLFSHTHTLQYRFAMYSVFGLLALLVPNAIVFANRDGSRDAVSCEIHWFCIKALLSSYAIASLLLFGACDTDGSCYLAYVVHVDRCVLCTC